MRIVKKTLLRYCLTDRCALKDINGLILELEEAIKNCDNSKMDSEGRTDLFIKVEEIFDELPTDLSNKKYLDIKTLVMSNEPIPFYSETELAKMVSIMPGLHADVDKDIQDLLGKPDLVDGWAEFIVQMSTGIVPYTGRSTYEPQDLLFFNKVTEIVADCEGDMPKIRLLGMTRLLLTDPVLNRYMSVSTD